VQRRIELKPSLSAASKRTAPQWHWPARTFVSPTMLPVSPVQITDLNTNVSLKFEPENPSKVHA
jgi:hypothetical protein